MKKRNEGRNARPSSTSLYIIHNAGLPNCDQQLFLYCFVAFCCHVQMCKAVYKAIGENKHVSSIAVKTTRATNKKTGSMVMNISNRRTIKLFHRYTSRGYNSFCIVYTNLCGDLNDISHICQQIQTFCISQPQTMQMSIVQMSSYRKCFGYCLQIHFFLCDGPHLVSTDLTIFTLLSTPLLCLSSFSVQITNC